MTLTFQQELDLKLARIDPDLWWKQEIKNLESAELLLRKQQPLWHLPLFLWAAQRALIPNPNYPAN